MKRCTRCFEEKPFTDFGIEWRSDDSLTKQCRKCLRQSDMVRKNRELIGGGLRRAIVEGNNKCAVFEHLPYGLNDLLRRLDSTMPEGYSWPDFNQLHIDHIIPISSFDIKRVGDDDFLACWGLDNLQLLPANENLRKSAKTPGDPLFDERWTGGHDVLFFNDHDGSVRGGIQLIKEYFEARYGIEITDGDALKASVHACVHNLDSFSL